MNFKYTHRCAFFSGEIDKPAQGILQRGKRKAVNVGICLDGVYVMDVKEKVSTVFVSQLCKATARTLFPTLCINWMIIVSISPHETFLCHVFLQHVLLGLRFSELSWDHSYPDEEGDSHILWLEFDGEEDGTPVNKLLKIYSKQVRESF